MTAFGNDPGPYTDKGYRQCLESIRVSSRKAQVILKERDDEYDYKRGLPTMYAIELAVVKLLERERREAEKGDSG